MFVTGDLVRVLNRSCDCSLISFREQVGERDVEETMSETAGPSRFNSIMHVPRMHGSKRVAMALPSLDDEGEPALLQPQMVGDNRKESCAVM